MEEESFAFDTALPLIDLQGGHLFNVAGAHIGFTDLGCIDGLKLAKLIWHRTKDDPTYKIIERSSLLRSIFKPTKCKLDTPNMQPYLINLLRWFSPAGDDQEASNTDPVLSRYGFISLLCFIEKRNSLDDILEELCADTEYGTEELRVAASDFIMKKMNERQQRKENLITRQKRGAQFQYNMHRCSGGGSHSLSIC